MIWLWCMTLVCLLQDWDPFNNWETLGPVRPGWCDKDTRNGIEGEAMPTNSAMLPTQEATVAPAPAEMLQIDQSNASEMRPPSETGSTAAPRHYEQASERSDRSMEAMCIQRALAAQSTLPPTAPDAAFEQGE